MFERFTDRARRAVVLAQEEARTLNHNYIGTEHILLGLIGESEGLAARALQQLDVSLEVVRSQVVEIIGQGQAAPTGHMPFTPRAKKVLELSFREALELGHNYIGTEHILLGLMREGNGVAAQILEQLGANLETVRLEVVRFISEQAEKRIEGVVVEEADVEAVMGRTTLERRRGPGWRVERLGPNVRLRREEGEPDRSPVCPRCDADLGASVRLRVQDVANGTEEEPSSRKVSFLYCSECGRVLAANLLEPDSAEEAGETDQPEVPRPEGAGETGAMGGTGEFS